MKNDKPKKNKKEKTILTEEQIKKRKTRNSRIVACCFLLLLGVGVAGNWYWENSDISAKVSSISSGRDKVLGEATYVDATTTQPVKENAYFSSARVDRQTARDESLEKLQKIVDSTKDTDKAHIAAADKIASISDIISTENKIETLVKAKGVNIGYVTLHVGLGTFRPVKVDDVTKHTMHTEHYIMPQETADLINETKKNGKRVISVGTTSCRTLESVATKNGCICADEDDTSIFIYPGYEFKCIDALVTNFHLPESTLIMLISAFAGYDHVMNAYKIAVAEKYRFFSFGDAMFIC